MSSSSGFSSDNSDFDIEDDVSEGATVGTVMPSVQISLAPGINESIISEDPEELPIITISKAPSSSEDEESSQQDVVILNPPEDPIFKRDDNLKLSIDNKKPIKIESNVSGKSFPSPIVSPIFKSRATASNKAKDPIKNHKSNSFMDESLEENLFSLQKIKAEPIDVERLYKYKEKVNRKVKELAEAQVKKEMEDCTFKPNIKSSKEKRTIDEFVNDMQRLEKSRENAIDALRKETLKAQGNFGVKAKPTICKKSVSITSLRGRTSQPVFEKLYKDHTKRTKEILMSPVNKIENRSFTPKINMRSQKLERSESIESRLYSDAITRKQKSESLSPAPSIKSKFISQKSEKVLISKFEQEFEKKISELSSTGDFNYIKFTAILKNMSFVSELDEDSERNLLISA